MPPLNPSTWTALGTLGSRHRSIVDQAGLVAPFGQGWLLDWWVGGDDRWHFPSRETAVRQRLLSGTPVVETAMRVPGGDAIHRAYGLRGPGSEDLVAVEIENRSPVPVAVAFVVRPGQSGGPGGPWRIVHDDRTVTVDERAALVLPHAPRFTAGSTGATAASGDGGGLAGMVESGAATPAPLGSVRDATGSAQAALLFPLAHGATLTAMIADGPVARPALPAPAAAGAVRSWQAQTRRGMRLDLPSGMLADAIDANRRFLYLFHDDVIALDQYGFHDDAARVLVDQSVDDAARLWALAEHWRLSGDDDLIVAMAPDIARAASRIQRRRQKARRRSDPESRGLVDPSYAENFFALRGLLDGALLLALAGEQKAAWDVAGAAEAFKQDIDASLAAVASRLGSLAIPAGPHRSLDAGGVEALVACAPLQLYPATGPAITATVQVANDHYRVQERAPAVLPQYVLRLAAVDLERGDRRALAWLSRLLDQASPTWTWPPARGEGHDSRAAGEFCSLTRRLLVRDLPGGLAICTFLPEGWRGQSVEVHDAPTHAGTLSFAVRWHEDRPALLWELRLRRREERIQLTAPGLDHRWRSDQPAGDALLRPMTPSRPA